MTKTSVLKTLRGPPPARPSTSHVPHAAASRDAYFRGVPGRSVVTHNTTQTGNGGDDLRQKRLELPDGNDLQMSSRLDLLGTVTSKHRWNYLGHELCVVDPTEVVLNNVLVHRFRDLKEHGVCRIYRLFPLFTIVVLFS